MKWIRYPNRIEKPTLRGMLQRAVILFAILSVFQIGCLLYYFGNPFLWTSVDWFISGMLFLGLLTQMLIFEAGHWTVTYVLHKFTDSRQVKASITTEEIPENRLNKNSKMKIRRWIFQVIVMSIFVLIFLNFEQITCSGSHENIQCLAKNPLVFQLIDSSGDATLNTAMTSATAAPCADLQMSADTFKVLFAIIPSNVHYSEEAEEMIDEILAKQPECLIKISELMNKDDLSELNQVLNHVDKVSAVDYERRVSGETDEEGMFHSRGRKSLSQFLSRDEYKDALTNLNVTE